jgi:SAM-dependent methyltransferase
MPQVPPVSRAGKVLRELRRGAQIARDGGAHAGWIFLREEIARNTWTRLVPTRSPRVECNVCGWKGKRFLTHCGAGYVNYDAFCPRCMCYPRHRGFAELLGRGIEKELDALRAKGGRRIFFAPEPGMKSILSRHVSGLEGVDIRRINDLVVHVEDIQELSFPTASVDFFSCFHVVEHVPDPDAALSELARVLKPDGLGIFNVPMTFGRRETVAFGRANPLANGHWFDFGEDFVERLDAAGFAPKGYRLRDELTPTRYDELRLQDEMIFLLRK